LFLSDFVLELVLHNLIRHTLGRRLNDVEFGCAHVREAPLIQDAFCAKPGQLVGVLVPPSACVYCYNEHRRIRANVTPKKFVETQSQSDAPCVEDASSWKTLSKFQEGDIPESRLEALSGRIVFINKHLHVQSCGSPGRLSSRPSGRGCKPGVNGAGNGSGMRGLIHSWRSVQSERKPTARAKCRVPPTKRQSAKLMHIDIAVAN
jgi:hypothetical protein